MNRQKEQYIERTEKSDDQWLVLDRKLILILNSSCCVELFKPHSECRVWRERKKKKKGPQ